MADTTPDRSDAPVIQRDGGYVAPEDEGASKSGLPKVAVDPDTGLDVRKHAAGYDFHSRPDAGHGGVTHLNPVNLTQEQLDAQAAAKGEEVPARDTSTERATANPGATERATATPSPKSAARK